MAPPGWANDEQKAWLHGWLPEFIRRQAEKKLHMFWPPRLKLPLPTDTEARKLTDNEMAAHRAAILVRKNKLTHWFRHQRTKIGNAAPSSGVATVKLDALISSLHKLKQKVDKRRAHQPIEVFQMRNREAIKAALTAERYDTLSVDEEDDLVDEADGSEAADRKSTKSLRMRLRTRVVAAMWKTASPEETKAVLAAVEKEKEDIRDAEKKLENTVEAVLSPAALQDFCLGETPAGNDFEDSCVDFDKNVVEAFEGFLQMVFSVQECRSRALDERPSNVTDSAQPATVIPPAPVPVAPASLPAKKKRAKKNAHPKLDTSASALSATTWNSETLESLPDDVPALEPVSAMDNSDAEDFFRGTQNFDDNDFLGETQQPIDLDAGSDAGLASGSLDRSVLSQTDRSTALRNEPLCDNNAILTTLPPGNVFLRPSPIGARWPSGMTAPLSPAAAEVLMASERGGRPNTSTTATPVIDPALEGLGFAPQPPPSEPARPRPVPAFRGAPVYKPSGLFEAFRGSGTPRSPSISSFTSAPVPAPATPDTFTIVAAPALHGSGTPIISSVATAPGHTASVKPTGTGSAAARFLSQVLAPPILYSLPTSTGTPPSALAPSTALTPSTGVAPPMATPPSPSTPPANAPRPHPWPSLPLLLLRLPLSLLPPPLHPRRPPPLYSLMTAAKKEAVAKQAQVTERVKKRRGRPPKAKEPAVVDDALQEVTNAPTAETGTIVLCTKVGNNRAEARRAALQEKAEEAKAAEDARKAQLARGWLPGLVEGSVVILGPRVPKPTRNCEGTEFVCPKVNTHVRAPQLDASEKALLARAAAAKATKASAKTVAGAKTAGAGAKRKAPAATSTAGPSKKQKKKAT
ncbi:hypothetical protein K438DRAFT_1775791 [Mycena galopus ATCC 62051]|nr:hypothetical protein K438DRAFT_1775791 [Mycena galopus ATCC 62051]